MSAFADAAMAYLEMGFEPILLEPRGKRPLTPEWQKIKITADYVRDVWRDHPDGNVGLRTGHQFDAIDFDDPAALRKVLDLHGPDCIPSTPAQRTGRGYQLLFRATGHGNGVELDDAIDYRGIGGQIVAPPSIHPNGRQYSWQPGRGPTVEIAAAPEWVMRLLNKRQRGTAEGSQWRHALREGVGEGSRNSTLASICGHLAMRKVDPRIAEALVQGWNASLCRPPLDADEVLRTLISIYRKEVSHVRAR